MNSENEEKPINNEQDDSKSAENDEKNPIDEFSLTMKTLQESINEIHKKFQSIHENEEKFKIEQCKTQGHIFEEFQLIHERFDELGKNEDSKALDLKVGKRQESIDEIRNEQKAELEELKNQQNLILEELRKINKTEEQKKTEKEKKRSFNSIILRGPKIEITVPSVGTPPVGRSFVLKHVFENVSKFEEGKWNCSEKEEHFGVPWCMVVYKKEQHLEFYLHCSKSVETGNWAIDTKFNLKVVRANRTTTSADCHGVFGYSNENKKSTTWGRQKFISLEDLKKDYLIDDKLKAEIYVTVNMMTGAYKKNLRDFDVTKMKYSDVVLIVKNQKFYVSKLFLADHSNYFDSLFLGPFLESDESEIELSGIEPEDFQNFLEVLYGHSAIDEFTVEGIVMLADMYDTTIVIEKCETFLLEKSEKTLKKKLQMAIRYNLDKLKRKCLSEMKTVADIQSVIPGNPRDLEPSIMSELLGKLASLR